MKRTVVAFAVTVLSVLLFSCSRPPDGAKAPEGVRVLEVDVPMTTTHSVAGEMRPGRQFGQTFTCKNNGLNRVEVQIATYGASLPSGTLIIHLRPSIEQPTDIAQVAVPANTIKDNSYVALDFPAIRDSAGKSYYLMLEARDIPFGFGLTAWRSETDVYPDGVLYIDGKPQPQDMCFRVSSVH